MPLAGKMHNFCLLSVKEYLMVGGTHFIYAENRELRFHMPKARSLAKHCRKRPALSQPTSPFQQTIRRRIANGSRIPVSNLERRKIAQRHDKNHFMTGNAIRGLIYAFLPSALLWATLIGIVYTIVKRW